MTESSTLSPQDEDWQRFRAIRTTVNHWQRPGWSPGREAYYWYLTFDDADLRALVGRCLSELELPYLDPVPLDGIHLTLPRLGWADEVSASRVEACLEAADQALATLRPFTMTVGPLAGSPGAVRLSVAPWGPLRRLQRELAALDTPDEQACEAAQTFRPHVGIAYCNSDVPTGPLIDRVGKLRHL